MTTEINTQAVFLTPAAAEVVRGLMKDNDLDDTYALRIYVAGRGCSGYQYGMALDNRSQEDDFVFESEGLKVIVDAESLQYMGGSRIDYIDDERGKGFLIENPNRPPACSCEGDSCGCG